MKHVKHQRIDSDQLVAADVVVPLRCAYRLGEVVDARSSGERAGELYETVFSFDDAVGSVRRSLLHAGVSENDPALPEVSVRILRLYMAQNRFTKIPVVVYEAIIDGAAPVLIRAQPASMNWSGSQDEAYDGYAEAFSAANASLIARLNARCASGDTPAQEP